MAGDTPQGVNFLFGGRRILRVVDGVSIAMLESNLLLELRCGQAGSLELGVGDLRRVFSADGGHCWVAVGGIRALWQTEETQRREDGGFRRPGEGESVVVRRRGRLLIALATR